MEQKYWFKRMCYGYGWRPSSWQGWLVMAVATAATLYLGFRVEEAENVNYLWEFFVPLLVIVMVLLAICNKTGEPLQWSGGTKEASDVDTTEN